MRWRPAEDRVPHTELTPLLRADIEEGVGDSKTPYLRGPHACRLCPIRHFDRRSRIRGHIAKDHDAPNGAGCPSSRVLRLITALFNRDQLLSASGLILGVNFERGPYLQRPCAIVAAWMSLCVDFFGRFENGEITQLDRHLRLCLTKNGPIYFIKGQEARSSYRLSGYTYYTADFAEILFSVAIRPGIKGMPLAIMDSFRSIYIASGCESCFLLPSKQDVYMSILDDILSFPNARLIRGRCMRHLNSQGEFDVVRHDGTYRMLMSLSGQPQNGAKIRCVEGRGGIREGARDRGATNPEPT